MKILAGKILGLVGYNWTKKVFTDHSVQIGTWRPEKPGLERFLRSRNITSAHIRMLFKRV